MEEIKIKLDESDLQALWDHSVKSRVAEMSRVQLLMSCLFAVLFLVFAPTWLADEQFQIAHYVVALVGIAVAFWYVHRTTSSRQAREWIQRTLRLEDAISYSVSVSPSEFIWKGRNVDIIVQWAGIEALHARESRLFVQMTPEWAIVIPSRSLECPENFAQLAANTTKYWQANREHLTCPDCQYDLRASPKTGCPECGWQRAENEHTKLL